MYCRYQEEEVGVKTVVCTKAICETLRARITRRLLSVLFFFLARSTAPAAVPGVRAIVLTRP